MTGEPQSELFLLEAFDLIGDTAILGAFYGIAFTLYCLCTRSLYLELRDPDKRRRARFTLGYTLLVFFCATGNFVATTRMIQLAYVDRVLNLPEGRQEHMVAFELAINPYWAISGVFDLVVEFLTLAVQIWRLWAIWRGTRYAVAVTLLPALLLLCYFAIAVLVEAVNGSLDQLGVPPHMVCAMITVNYALLSGATMAVTLLVTGRLLFERRRYIKLMGMSNNSTSPYLNIVAMLTESYALDSAWSIAATISLGTESPSLYLFITNDSTVKVIAYFLLVYRVSTGRRRTRGTECKLTSLRWDRGSYTSDTSTTGAGSIYSHGHIAINMVAADSLPIPHPELTV